MSYTIYRSPPKCAGRSLGAQSPAPANDKKRGLSQSLFLFG